jgi:hypothetical protein
MWLYRLTREQLAETGFNSFSGDDWFDFQPTDQENIEKAFVQPTVSSYTLPLNQTNRLFEALLILFINI